MRVMDLMVCLTAFASACSYSHIGPSLATFSRAGSEVGADAGPAERGPLVLNIRRHIDTIIRGPDIEEDQLLVLEVRTFRLNQRLEIPSENVTAEFTATRFGPPSTGASFAGYLIVKKITDRQVTAYLHLDVTARTASGSYTEQAKYRGDYVFYEATDNP
jgi:hypothetical protein